MNRNKTQLFRKPLIHSVCTCFLSTTRLFAYSIVALLFSGLISCAHSSADESNSPPAITQPPLTIPLKLEDKYQINPFTGDSTFDKINMEGNVVETGVPIPAKGVVMSPEQYAKPVITKAGQPKRIANPHPNRNIIPVRQNVVPVDEDKLTKIPLGGGDPNSIIVNSHGDTIPSGVPLPLKGRTVPCLFPPLTKALPSVFKDAAFKDFSYLDVDQGLLMSFVMSIMEDSKGNIWFGTQGKGVSRYDGEYFTHFTTENGLVDGRIWSIVEDQKGNIWFGADHSGLSKFDGNAFTNFYEQEGLSINSVKSLLADSEDNIWIGSGGAGVSKIHGDSITHYGPKEGMPGKSVISIYQDRDENIWFGVYRTGVVRFDGKTFSQFTEEDGLMGSTPWDIIQDRVGQMWFGTDNGGFSKYDGKAFTQFTTPDGSPYNTIYALLEDHQGNICFATNGNGLQVFDGKEITQYATEEGLTSDIIWSMLKDSENNLWLGMIAGGAMRYNPNSFELFSEKQGLPSNIVFKTQQDSSGKIWFGYQGEGVCFYDGDNLYQYGAEEGMPLVAIEDILFDSKGNVWFTSYGMGVMKFDGTYFYHYTTAQGLAGDVVYSLAEDNDGNIWMGTENAGLSKYNGAYFTNFSEKEGLASNVVFKIIKAQNGHLWLASSGGGITEYDGQTFFHYSVKEGLPDNNVWSILESSDHSIWVGTAGNGLCRFTPNSPEKTFTSYTKSSGQPEPDIFGLAEDRNNKIWGTGETGIICLSPNQNNPSTNEAITDYRITHLTKKDGLKSVSFFTNSILIDQNNHGWFGGGNGIAMLDLNTFKLSTQTPQPHLLQIEINNQLPDFRYIRDSMEQKKYFDSVASFQNYPLHPEIPFSKNHLAFYFSAIDWNSPNKVKYSFRIEGLNDNWSEPSKETKADYRNIPYGDYTFQVCAIGESQQWSEPTNYAFTINPPWWHTWWARVGYLIAGLFAVIGIVRWRTASLRKEAKILEHKIDEATVVIRTQKEEVEAEKKISDDLLLNILPAEVAEELKQKGNSEAKHFDDVTVLFTDFKAFTEISEQLSARDLVDEINTCFSAFDHIVEKHNIEKIKTVGDSYMAAGGLPVPNNTNAKDAVLAALEIREFMLSHHEGSLLAGKPGFEIRIGVNTGPVVAGIVGIKKFQYDLWGDTVNTASRMETASEPGKVNISQSTYRLLKDDPSFTFEHRGEIEVKGKGAIGMWFVEKRV